MTARLPPQVARVGDSHAPHPGEPGHGGLGSEAAHRRRAAQACAARCRSASSWYWIALRRTRSAPASSRAPRTFAGTPAASIPAGISCRFEHQGPGRHERPRPDHRVIQQHGAHADQAAVLDRRAVDDRAVADADARADRGRDAGVDVDRRVVLQVASLAEHDVGQVAAQHRAVEDAGVGEHPHAADQGGVRRDPGGRVDLGGVSVERKQQSHAPTLSSAARLAP